jgi:hypothetical protein
VTLELVPLATMTAVLDTPFVLEGTPSGGRYIFEIATLEIESDRPDQVEFLSARSFQRSRGPEHEPASSAGSSHSQTSGPAVSPRRYRLR